MNAQTHIQAIATQIAGNARDRASTLESELAAIEARKPEIQAQLRTARLAAKRLADFQVKVEGQYQCPNCWIEHGTKAMLKPIGSGADSESAFCCQSCGLQISIEF